MIKAGVYFYPGLSQYWYLMPIMKRFYRKHCNIIIILL